MKCDYFYTRQVTLTPGMIVPTAQGLYKIGDTDTPITLSLGDAIAMLTKLRLGASQFTAAAADLQRLLDNRLADIGPVDDGYVSVQPE